MKRGKRQVIGPQPQQQENSSPEHSDQSNHSTYFTNLATSNNPPTVITYPKPLSQQTVSVKPMSTLSQIIPLETQHKTNEDQQRRKRVEMLKQKYIKKNDDKGDGLKTVSNLGTTKLDNSLQPKVDDMKSNYLSNILPVASELLSDNNQSFLKQEKINEKPIPTIKQNSYEMNKFKAPLTIKETNNINGQKEYPLASHEKEQTLNTKSEEICSQNDSHQEIALQNELSVKRIPHHEVPKPPAKHHFKNPPPPPHFKRPPQPQNQTDIEYTQNQPTECIPVTMPQELSTTIAEKVAAKIIPPTSPFIAQPQILSSNSSKSEKQDNISFAPPSTIVSTDKFQTVQQNRLPPPPLPNRNMKDLLNKKLSSNKNVPKPPQRIIQQQIPQDIDQNGFNERDPGWGNDIPMEVNNKMIKKQSQIDEQYNTITQLPSHSPKHPSTSHTPLPQQPRQQSNPQEYISQWLTSSQLTLKQLNPDMKQAIEFYCLNKHLPINLTSSNPSFTPLIKQLIESFMIKNALRYTQEQKAVAESICMTFFYTNPAEFSDIFLIVLVKLSGHYLNKYQQALEDQFMKYLQRILMYKNILLPQEINLFANFSLQHNMVNEKNIILFLMLTSQTGNNQLLQFISQSDIHSLSTNLSILSYCQLNIKSKNFLPLYLKTISNLQPQWVKNGMVEKILNHLKSIDIPEHLYQYTKQLKLKLLKNYESNGSINTEQQKFNEVPNQSMNTQSQTNKDTGLFGLFNINKAIDKIKISTEKALGAVQKQKKPQQEQKKDEIIYDPIRKRYIINGQIPEDQNQPLRQQAQQQKTKIPPPPPMGGRKPPPPMAGKKTGGRITMNRYA